MGGYYRWFLVLKVVDVVKDELKTLDAPAASQPVKCRASQSGFVKKASRKSGADLLPSTSSKETNRGFRVLPIGVDVPPSVHYARPPTAASLRQARKQQKLERLLASNTSSTPDSSSQLQSSNDDELLKQLPGGANNNKLRVLRSRRSGGNCPVPLPSSTSSIKGRTGRHVGVLQIGSRVIPSPGRNTIMGNTLHSEHD